MSAPAAELIRMNLPCDPGAPGAVRDALDRTRDIGCVRDDVALIATELVTNAVRHSGCSSDQTLEVRVDIRSQRLRISVRDPGGSGGEAKLRPGRPFGGWGLQIVDQIADRWGSERRAGYQVWAEIGIS